MEKGLYYPKSSMEIKMLQRVVDFLSRWGVKQELIDMVKEQLHFDGVATYPDGSGDPAEDISKFTNI